MPPNVRQLRQSVDDVATLAARELDAVWRGLPDAVVAREALLDTLPALTRSYGAAAGTVAADWYDDVRDGFNVRHRFSALTAAPVVAGSDVLARVAVGPLFSATPDFDAARTLAEGGLQRHIANTARDTIRLSSIADPDARGWMRVTSGGCAFCEMLAGRGAVYSEASVDFQAHDHCRCVAAPVFEDRPEPDTHEPDDDLDALAADETPPPAPVVIQPPAAPRLGVSPSAAVANMPGPKTAVGASTREALDAIAKVHRVPDGIRPVPVSASKAKGFYGVYESDIRGTPKAIRLAAGGDHMEGTFTHEFGHYLDNQANLVGQRARGAQWGTSPVSVEQSPPMQRFFAAVEASPTKQALNAAPNTEVTETFRRKTLAPYYRQKNEVWARAYHQWIATRSKNPKMLQQIADIRADPDLSRSLSQWAPDEFEPIAQAMDDIFKEAGLLE